jgi:hypothetical protein
MRIPEHHMALYSVQEHGASRNISLQLGEKLQSKMVMQLTEQQYKCVSFYGTLLPPNI